MFYEKHSLPENGVFASIKNCTLRTPQNNFNQNDGQDSKFKHRNELIKKFSIILSNVYNQFFHYIFTYQINQKWETINQSNDQSKFISSNRSVQIQPKCRIRQNHYKFLQSILSSKFYVSATSKIKQWRQKLTTIKCSISPN